MAVQVRWPDGSHQWLPGRMVQGRNPREHNGIWYYEDGFTIYQETGSRDMPPDVGAISQTLEDNVIDWSRRPNQS